MKILQSGKKKTSKLVGQCQECGCKVECEHSETKTLVDRDTTVGSATHYVKCPECGHKHLWVQ